MKVTNNITLNGNFETSTEINNSTFYRTKLKVYALGENRNGSAFSLDSFEQAKKSLKLVPVVAKYEDSTDIHGSDGDLTSHNASLRETDSGLEIHYDTFPIGVISNTSNFSIEEVNEGTEESPNFKQYIVADEVYLWKRYEATKKIVEWIDQGISPKISMEIGKVEGSFDEDSGYFKIDNFEIEAVAALGSDIEPCFPRAEITTYSKKEFKEELKELVFELNKTLSDETKGGNEQMTKENKQEEEVEVVKAYEKTEVEFETTEPTENEQPEKDDQSEETPEDNPTEDNPTTPETDNTESDNPDNFTETPEQFEDESTTESTEDNTEETDEAESVSEETTEEDEPKVDYEAKFNETSIQLETLQNDFASLQSQLTELQSYKRQREETDLKAKFEGKLSDEEFNQVFTDMQEMELDKVEEKLFALIGKKNFSIESTTKTDTNVNKIKIVQPKDKKFNNPFDELIANYTGK